MLDAVDLEPLLLRRRAHESLEVSARMKTLAAPVPGREQRYRHLRPVGQARAPVLVGGERVLPAILVEVAAVRSELLLGQGRRPGHPFAVQTAPIATVSPSVLNAEHLGRKPRPAECAEDAAVMAEVAIVVGRALPDADGTQVRRLEGRHL